MIIEYPTYLTISLAQRHKRGGTMAPAPLNARLSRENVEAKNRFLNDKSGKTLRRVMYACIKLESFRLACLRDTYKQYQEWCVFGF